MLYRETDNNFDFLDYSFAFRKVNNLWWVFCD